MSYSTTTPGVASNNTYGNQTLYYQQPPQQQYAYTTTPQTVQTEPLEPVVKEDSHEKSVKKEKSKKEIKYVFLNTPPKTKKEQVEFLHQYHFYILIDSSASMGFEITDDEGDDDEGDDDGPAKTTGMKVVKEYLKTIVSEAIYDDKQGVSVCLFNKKIEPHDKVESHEQIETIFDKHKPHGGTALDKALKWALHKHFEKKSVSHNDKHTIILVITDGKPDDEKAAENVIIHYANKIGSDHVFTHKECKKSHELGIRFFQVGKDEGATKYLNVLAHKLRTDGAKFDMASTGNITELHSTDDVRQAFISAIYG